MLALIKEFILSLPTILKLVERATVLIEKSIELHEKRLALIELEKAIDEAKKKKDTSKLEGIFKPKPSKSGH